MHVSVWSSYKRRVEIKFYTWPVFVKCKIHVKYHPRDVFARVPARISENFQNTSRLGVLGSRWFWVRKFAKKLMAGWYSLLLSWLYYFVISKFAVRFDEEANLPTRRNNVISGPPRSLAGVSMRLKFRASESGCVGSSLAFVEHYFSYL